MSALAPAPRGAAFVVAVMPLGLTAERSAESYGFVWLRRVEARNTKPASRGGSHAGSPRRVSLARRSSLKPGCPSSGERSFPATAVCALRGGL